MACEQYFEGERYCRERGLEEPREARRHACDKQYAVRVLEVELGADVVPESGANLHRDAFAAGTAPEQVSEPRARNDHRDHTERNLIFLAMGDCEHHVHPAFGSLAELLVCKGNQYTRNRECRNPVKRVRIAQIAEIKQP